MTEVASMQQSFENLALQSIPKLTRVDRAQSKASDPARYPELPEGFATHERYYTLGWILPDGWLEEFARQRCRNIEKEFMSPDVLGLWQLHRMSGYEYIFLVGVLQDGTPVPEDWTDPNIPIHTVLGISFTATRFLFRRRPTQVQYDWYNSLFGSEARWYRDLIPKDLFYLNGICV
ncbi:hypothetical protein AcV7_005965 [Taiwanofungus camphoratus]|nr:hypothetical protein AcV7_005965 [Antrodia cinnamomea]